MLDFYDLESKSCGQEVSNYKNRWERSSDTRRETEGRGYGVDGQCELQAERFRTSEAGKNRKSKFKERGWNRVGLATGIRIIRCLEHVAGSGE